MAEPTKRRGLIKDTDRHGNVRWYYRRKGQKKVRLEETPGSEEFEEEFAAAVLGVVYVPKDKPTKLPQPLTGPRIIPNSLAWLVQQYMTRMVAGQAKATGDRKRLVLEEICAETCLSKSERPAGEIDFRKIEPKHIALLRDQKPGRPEAANTRVKILSAMYAWAKDARIAKTNPASEVKKFTNHTDGHHTLTEAEIAAFERRHPPGTKAHLAFMIFRYTELRVCDAAIFGRQHLYMAQLPDGEEELRFRITPRKTQNSTGVVVDMPVLPPLAQAIAITPKSPGVMAFLTTSFGKRFTEKGLGNKMREWFDEVTEMDLKHCSSHGIRKAGATLAAENGATSHQLMGMFGWTTLKQAENYTRKVQRQKLASDGAKHLMVKPQGR